MEQQFILASGSPRRKEIFRNLGLDFTVVPADIDETITKQEPGEIVMQLSKQKAEHVLKKTGGLVVAADTIVWHQGKALGKPKDQAHAKQTLTSLSGQAHEVYTGVCIASKELTICDFCKTKVYFKPLNNDEILRYIQTGEPMDKAGAYGISGLGAVLVEKIEGDFFNVVGFPISLFSTLLSENFGYNIV